MIRSVRPAHLLTLVCLLLSVAAGAQIPMTAQPHGFGLDLDLGFERPTDLKVTEMSGQAPNGSYYRFSVPDGWQPTDGLVIWNHGYDFNPPGPDPSLGPLEIVQLGQGYAIAASSYSGSQWTLATTVEDLEQMMDAFHDQFGVPAFIMVTGASLGGLVTVQAIEQADIGNVVGGMPICGALSGSRGWDGAFDIRAIYDLVCSEVPGAAIPGFATGLPFPPDPAFDATALGGALQACFGLYTPDMRTDEQQARIADFLKYTQIPENFIETDMFFVTFGLFDLVWLKNGGLQVVGNAEVEYEVDGMTFDPPRVEADPAGRAALASAYVPNGNVGDVKIVSIHTDKDGLVLVESESDYAEKVPAENFSLGVIVEDVPSHCEFTVAETLAAWESLRAWVAGITPQPDAAALQAACEAIDLGAGGMAGPCRIDPTYVVPSIDERIRRRQVCDVEPGALCLAGDRFEAVIRWADFDGNDGDGTAVPQTDDTGAFYFFDPSNLEMMVKVLDGRQINGNFWVFYGSLTNVEFELTVTDTITGVSKTYTNPLGNFASDGDTAAF